jgi:hypothetical protein
MGRTLYHVTLLPMCRKLLDNEADMIVTGLLLTHERARDATDTIHKV